MGGGGQIGQLTVHVFGAQGLVTRSFSGNCKPYCTISFENQTFKTDVQNSTNPQWNHTVSFEIFNKPSPQITVCVWEKSPFPSRFDSIGTLVISLDFQRPFVLKNEYPLMTETNGESTLKLKIEYNVFEEPR